MNEHVALTDHASVAAGMGMGDTISWKAKWTVDKYHGAAADVLAGKLTPYETQVVHTNLAMNGGWDVIWKRLITLKPSTGLASVTSAFSTKAAIALGQSSATSTASQTNLQGTNARVVMDSGFPSHTTGTSTTARSATFRVTFSSAKANFAVKEFGLFNTTSTSAGAFRMLNRKVQSLGTKTSAATWQVSLTLTGS